MHTRTRPARSLAVLGAASTLVLAGCGGSDAADTTTPTTVAPTSGTTAATMATDAGAPTTVAEVDEVSDAPAASDGGATPEPASPGSGDTITISDFTFAGVTEVPAGTTIVVTNTDTAPHTFTADDGAFDSGSIRQDETFEFTFDTVGEFAYHCNFHGSMTGTITVTG